MGDEAKLKTPPAPKGEDDVLFVEANWKMELLHNIWFGMCIITFDHKSYLHMNTSRGFPLANPTHLRCAAVSCIMALEIVKASPEIKGFLKEEGKVVVVYHTNKALDSVLRTCKNKKGIIKRLQSMAQALPPNVKLVYFKEEKSDAPASIKTGVSLMNSHTIVFENPKEYKEEQQKKKADPKDPQKVLGQVQHVREQDLLLGQLLASGAKPGRHSRRPKMKTPTD